MATITPGLEANNSASANLNTAQAGNGDSTNVVDRGSATGPASLQISATAGGAPTVTVNILGSVDGTNFYNVPYSTVAAPATQVIAALVLTATAVTLYYLRRDFAWRYLKLALSANNNVTLTSDLFILAD